MITREAVAELIHTYLRYDRDGLRSLSPYNAKALRQEILNQQYAVYEFDKQSSERQDTLLAALANQVINHIRNDLLRLEQRHPTKLQLTHIFSTAFLLEQEGQTDTPFTLYLLLSKIVLDEPSQDITLYFAGYPLRSAARRRECLRLLDQLNIEGFDPRYYNDLAQSINETELFDTPKQHYMQLYVVCERIEPEETLRPGM